MIHLLITQLRWMGKYFMVGLDKYFMRSLSVLSGRILETSTYFMDGNIL